MKQRGLRLMNKFKGKKVLVFGLGLNQGGVGSANNAKII